MHTSTLPNSRMLRFCLILAVFAPPAAGFWLLRRESFVAAAFCAFKKFNQTIVNLDRILFFKKLGRKRAKNHEVQIRIRGITVLIAQSKAENGRSRKTEMRKHFEGFGSIRIC